MRTYATRDIRQLLREHPDGLDLKTIAERVERSEENVRKLLKDMPDTYIDRWQTTSQKSYSAVWCVVVPPDNCPHPTRQVVAVRPRGWKDSREDERDRDAECDATT